MKLILSHPTGNTFSRALADHLLRHDNLAAFHTSFAIFEGSFLDRLGGLSPLKEIRRRRYKAVLRPYIRTSPRYELGRMLSGRLGLSDLTKHESGIFSIDSVYRRADQHAAKSIAGAKSRGVNGIYAYEDGALASFLAAKAEGIKCIYDLPIAYWKLGRRLMTEEAERLPEWAPTLGGGISDSPEKLARKDQELDLADTVVVPSDFVAESLPEQAQSKNLIIAPFGSPPCCEARDYAQTEKKTSPLRVLFAGSMGQRKGLGDLFGAIKLLKTRDIELVVMGSLLAPIQFYRDQLPCFTYEPVRAHADVLELMRSCDVFCLPSIVEGRALVMQEAMSQGLPLIITPNTGGSDLIEKGKTGFLVPIRSPESIAEKLDWFIVNRKDIPEMGRRAMEHASRYTWQAYAEKIVDGIADTLRSN